jgi:hypothetical protein
MSRTPNQSPEPTAVGACSSAVAIDILLAAWLSSWSLDANESFAPENMKIDRLKFFTIVVITIAAFELYRSIAAHTESHLMA